MSSNNSNHGSDNGVFAEFVGHEVKVPYRDGSQFKIARGVLEDINSGFVKITGKLGTIVINQKNIERISKVNPSWHTAEQYKAHTKAHSSAVSRLGHSDISNNRIQSNTRSTTQNSGPDRNLTS